MKNWLITLLCFCFFALGFGELNAQIGRIKIRPDVDTTYVCPDSSITLEVTGGFNYSWSPANILNRSNGNVVVAKPSQNTRIFVEGFVNGQLRRDTITLVVVRPQLQLIALNAASVCRGTPVRLRAVNNAGGQGITWDPIDGLNNPDVANVIALPENTTTYRAELNITGCKVDATITVEIAPQKIDITNGDTVKVCKGAAKVKLSATTNTGQATGVTWTAKDRSITRQNVLSIDVEPKITTTYYVTFVATPCTIIDSVVVKVDSLPTQTITIDPKKEVYCFGEIITLKSTTYETAAYPDIKHLWRPRFRADGSTPGYDFQTPDTLWNMVMGTIDSVVLIRDTRNNGCIDSAAIFVPVIKPKTITITPEPAEVCPGGSVRLTASFAGNFDKIAWTPMAGLSCTDCKNPNVTPSQTTTYNIMVEEKGCPSNASKTVTVLPRAAILFPNLRTVCQGGSIQLNGASQSGVTYRWTQGGNVISTDPLHRVTPTATTTYRLEATDVVKGCNNSGDITINVVPTVNSVDINGVTVCSNDRSNRPTLSIRVNQSPGTVPALLESYNWQVLGSTVSTGTTLSLNNINTTSLVSVAYTYGVQGGATCGRLTDTATVKVIRMPTENGIFFAPDSVGTRGAQEGDPLTAGILLVQPQPPVAVTYNWTINGNSPGNNTNPTIATLASPGAMTFKVVVTGPNGCAITKELTINVVPASVTIPNAFSPNGDGANDIFRPVTNNKNIRLVELKVFNRWGKMVYNGNTGWNGNVGGNPAPVDVYIYNMVIEFPGGRRETRSGDVALLR